MESALFYCRMDVPRAVDLHWIGVGALAAQYPVGGGVVINVRPLFGPAQRA